MDAPVARATWDAFLDGASRHEAPIWRWLSLEVWARAFLDTRIPADQSVITRKGVLVEV
jgi:hypothetical protein